MKRSSFFLILIPILIYLFLRFGFRDSIEFGYDQPRLASQVIGYIKNGNILQTQKFAEKSPWGNVSWGPSLFLFFSPFFLISKNPIIVSLLISVFNLASIILVIYIGIRYFSFKTGLFAGIFLATMPWWWIFSRMIYQPTPVPTFMALMILLTFMALDKPKSFWIAPLIIIWGVLVQLYFHSVSSVTISAMFVITKIKKLSYKYITLGIILTSVLFLPYLKIQTVADYFPEKNIEVLIKGRDDPLSRAKNLIPHFFLIISGGDFSWQLGNGYGDFVKGHPEIEKIFFVISILTFLVIAHNLFTAIVFSKNRVQKLALILWTIAPIPFLTFIRLPSVPPIPRYFLLSLPPLSILWGITVEDLSTGFFWGSKVLRYGLVSLIMLIPLFWFCFDLNYSRFVTSYSYPNGPLSTYSDIPYLFLENSINFVLKYSAARGESNVVISNDQNNPRQFALDWATGYVWSNVYGKDKIMKDSGNSGNYLITVSPGGVGTWFKNIYKSGPYWVYRLESL